MSTVLNWDGKDVPEELRSLPKGRYVLVSVDEAPELTVEQDAGLAVALRSLQAGHGVARDEARRRVDVALGR